MTNIILKMTSQKTAMGRLFSYFKSDSSIIKHLNDWLRPAGLNYTLNIFRILKIILVT